MKMNDEICIKNIYNKKNYNKAYIFYNLFIKDL